MADPGFPVGGAVDPRGSYVSKILHVKTKESGPVGGGARAGRAPLDPPVACLPKLAWKHILIYIHFIHPKQIQ